MKPSVSRLRHVWHCREHEIELGIRTIIMAIVNATPDSFSGDGVSSSVERAGVRIRQMAAEGADIIDIGGESTRPGFTPIPAQEELERVLPVIIAARGLTTLPLSIDTTKVEVARAAIKQGASIINDVSGLCVSNALAQLAAETGAGLVLGRFPTFPTHQLRPEHKQSNLLEEVSHALSVSVETALAAGVTPEQIVIDPGFGFGLRWRESADLLRQMDELQGLGFPLLIGVSRKGFTGQPDGLPVEERAWSTAAAHAMAIERGAHALRVHDVHAARRVARFIDFVLGEESDARP
ncbi:MAG: dihydropteroate synthase [Chloroflexi bacterium]|nr:dihydropteroate synthase [Chloroflexota bacterium]